MLFRLACGRYAHLDPGDHARLRQYRYWIDGHGYAYRATCKNYVRRNVKMHHDVLPGVPAQYIDHIDGNKLNNTRANLRVVSPSVSSQNRRGRGVQGFKAVQTNKKRWQAIIMQGWQRKCLGTYDTPAEAAKAYDRAARQLYGEHAYLNFPGEP